MDDMKVKVTFSYGYVVQAAGPPVAVAPKFNFVFKPRLSGGTNEFKTSCNSLNGSVTPTLSEMREVCFGYRVMRHTWPSLAYSGVIIMCSLTE